MTWLVSIGPLGLATHKHRHVGVTRVRLAARLRLGLVANTHMHVCMPMFKWVRVSHTWDVYPGIGCILVCIDIILF